MRPEISDLLRRTIYPRLRDAPRVLQHPHVPGLVHDVFFLDHDHSEGGADEGASKRNEWEARFMVALARHITLQVGWHMGSRPAHAWWLHGLYACS
jgi:hypothetical protein